MTFDLLVLFSVSLFALLGAFSGFSRQVAQAVAGVLAIAAAAPSGRFFALPFSQALKSSLTVGVVAATIFSFIVIYLLVRVIVTAVLKRLLGGKTEKSGVDRFLGLSLGAAKALLMVWIGASAATFVENNLVLAGKKYSFTPKDSKVVAFSRQFNFIEQVQFAGGRELALAAKVADDPKAADKLKDDPSYAALMKDPRFKRLVQSDAWKKALETGDIRPLMQNNELVELLHDGKLSGQIERLAGRAEPSAQP